MIYQIQSARKAHPTRGEAVIMLTANCGAVIANPDLPEEWRQLQEWIQAGGVVASADPLPAPEKTELEELKDALIRKGVLLPTDIPTRALRDGTG